LSLRDEFGVLLPEGEKLKGALLFEEYLARNPGSLKLKEMKREALLHGHCHQKAFDAMPAVEKVLGMVPGLKVSTVQTSCCGMAGSFGYEAEHYDVSMKMAELSLLPWIRNCSDETLLVADGTSCRHQIADGSGRTAVHVARVLEQALV
jgi:Fe-S oxidoreductase